MPLLHHFAPAERDAHHRHAQWRQWRRHTHLSLRVVYCAAEETDTGDALIDVCLFGDCRDSMRKMIAQGVRVQTCVTSPPYWGLRSYLPNEHEDKGIEIGLESTPEEYVANMVEVFRLVRDLLADDGTLWLNLGDSYASDMKGSGGLAPSATLGIDADGNSRMSEANRLRANRRAAYEPRRVLHGLKPKDLVGIPWRVAFALQADGWYLRSDIIWSKLNPMPESVTDRPTKAHEYLFLMSKRERYFYDADAIKENSSELTHMRRADLKNTSGAIARSSRDVCPVGNGNDGLGAYADGATRNRRTVWTVATEPYAEAHFAVFPRALIEPCILAGTSQKGHCPACGKGWVRVTESGPSSWEARKAAGHDPRGYHVGDNTSQIAGNACVADQAPANATSTGGLGWVSPKITTGWQPSCACALDPVSGIVFDPFLGSGTTAQVAQDLGRHWLACELNPDYALLQRNRTRQQGMAFA